MTTLPALLDLSDPIRIVDIGAAVINEVPPYAPLLAQGIARLTAVDGDERQADAIRAAFGPETMVLDKMIADGRTHTLHVTPAGSGMTSLFQPNAKHLRFFNEYERFGRVLDRLEVETERLADVPELQEIDFLKMDVQGAELMILEHAGNALDQCVAIHTEAAFIPLYEGQPTFADLDHWMRAHGFLPHRMTELKAWSIFPTILDNDPRKPCNQLLECDVVYVRGLIDLSDLADDQLRKLAVIAATCYGSPDLCIHVVGELERRKPCGLPAAVLDWYARGQPEA